MSLDLVDVTAAELKHAISDNVALSELSVSMLDLKGAFSDNVATLLQRSLQ